MKQKLITSTQNTLNFVKRAYFIEVFLALVAICFFVYFVALADYLKGWKAEGLRIKFFILFGIVGLIGLSIGIRRNEIMLTDRQNGENRSAIERSHDLIFQLDSETQHIYLVAIHELEKLHRSSTLPQSEKRLIEIAIGAFIASRPPQDYETIGEKNREQACRKLFYMLGEDTKELAMTIFNSNAFTEELITGKFPKHIGFIFLPNDRTSLEDILLQYSGDYGTARP